jgi:hypothetical protein
LTEKCPIQIADLVLDYQLSDYQLQVMGLAEQEARVAFLHAMSKAALLLPLQKLCYILNGLAGTAAII